LGEQIDKNKNKVNRVLPTWLAKPDFVSVDLSDQQMPVQDMPGMPWFCSSEILISLNKVLVFIYKTN
jgi:hypothetical protein